MSFFKFRSAEVKTPEPNYKVLELQAENEYLKDKIIEKLEAEVSELKTKLKAIEAPLIMREEKDVGSHMISSGIQTRPRIRTVSDLSNLLEQRSLNVISLKPEKEVVE